MANETELEIDLGPILAFDLDLSQYFGLWAVESHRFLATFDRVARMDLFSHVAANTAEPQASARKSATKMGDDIAVLDIRGTMTKRGSSLAGGGMIEVRQQLRQAIADPEVEGILLRIDSPGGTVSGTADLANDVFKANKRKPVLAFAEDLAASAAFWVASQADAIIANTETAMVGSIGTFIGLHDLSGAAGQQGIRPIVIKSGQFKGAGFPGTEITTEQVAEWQTLVDKTQTQFTSSVARGRGMSESAVAELADGRVHMAADAVELGLVDGIGSFGDVVSELRTRASSRRNGRKAIAMSEGTKTVEANTATQAATFEQIKAALPTADADFICAQLGAKTTIEQAQSSWMAACEKRAREAEATAELAISALESMKSAPGVEELSESTATDTDMGDMRSEWNAKIDALVSQGMARAKAVSAVVKKHPDLHRGYVAMINEENKRPTGRFR